MFDLDPNENIVLKVRRHKLSLFFECFFLLLFVILPPLLFWISESNIQIRGNDGALFAGIYSAILLIAWMIFFIIWTNYYLDVLVVTEKRIIEIEQKGFFHRQVSTLKLDKIQDISVSVSGLLATFLDFGTLRIQSAGETPEFIIRDISEPNKIKAVIFQLHNRQSEAPQSVKVIQ